MSFIRRRDWFLGILIIISLIGYFFFDISFSEVSLSLKLAIISLVFSLYLLAVIIPTFLNELRSYEKNNEKLREQLVELKEQVRSLSWKLNDK
ncbi:hypothetical protein L7G72_16770 [Xenorhabdus bovienii]|uniref:hypothetical protein n=1 Tax=Xenorhabdus bovienii TaxID=40576 RepID=UPI001EDF46AF|nr:hypothetical protein [Xenorhabdus bovienii]MCG3463457.1 hypothetical protein [Xenorhabdus bovienii]